MSTLIVDDARASTPIHALSASDWPSLLQRLAPSARRFAESVQFEPKPGRHLLLPGETGALECVVFVEDSGKSASERAFARGALASLLPPGNYRFERAEDDLALTAFAWLTDAYRFELYRSKENKPAAVLVLPEGVDAGRAERLARAIAFGRDLINTPANDLSPDGLETAARELASDFDASFATTVGDALLAANLPMIHAVGRASATAPRLIDFSWGDRAAPKVTLVGKGVTFDTGGLNIKPDAAMLLMKKDMGGAATALAAARMVMSENLPVRLRVLVPAVENAISGCAFRPGDVLRSRKGLSVEIGNTDAEGRLILADALALADEDAPELMVDFATLTGAARVALGPDLPAFYATDDAFAAKVMELGVRINDPVWRLPFWAPYDEMLASRVADVSHISNTPFAGSVTAALFLKRFVEKARIYAHFDLFAWTPSARPGRPQGGEAQVARLIFETIERHFREAG
ncbi:MAG: leucyl aminopeptidase family protein [Hyphomicrobiales bacterium]|nr:leucyl aminopeptidase family protein [Hyphomicrobiales bacterium]